MTKGMPKGLRRIALILLALLIGPSAVSAIWWLIFDGAWNPDISAEKWVLAFNAGLISFPFVVLAMINRGGVLPWLLGLTLTASLWAYFLYDAVSHPDQGVNIGLGFLLLFSPILITFASVATAVFVTQSRRAAN